MPHPVVAGAGEHRRADEILLEDNLALDRGGVAILLVLHEVVDAGGARAEHFQDYDGIVHHSGIAWHRRADHEGVRIADRVGDTDLQVCGVDLTRVAAQPHTEGNMDVALDRRMPGSPAGHRHRCEAVEFPAQLLPLFPGKKLLYRHRAADGDAHGAPMCDGLRAAATVRNEADER